MAKSQKNSSKGAAGGTGLVPAEAGRAGEPAAVLPQRGSFNAERVLPWCFFLVFVALSLRSGSVLQYHIRCPAFYAEASFFDGFLNRPGGLVNWLAAMLLQSYSTTWAAAAVQTAIGAMSYFLFATALRKTHDSAAPFACLAPVALLLPLQNWPAEPVAEIYAGLLLSLGLLLVYAVFRAAPLALRAAVILILGVASYAASGGFLLFLAALGIFIALRRPGVGWIDMALWIAMAAGVPYLSTFWPYIQSPQQAYTRLLAFHPQWPMIAALSAFIAVAAAMTLKSWIRREPADAAPDGKSNPTAPWQAPACLAGVSVFACAVFFASSDQDRLVLPQLDYHARHGQWEQVLQEARRLHYDTQPDKSAAFVCASVDTLRALYHLGRLGSDCFAYWQYGNMPMLPSTSSFVWSLPMAETLFELGHVNYAEHWAHEAIELQGDRPELLLLLAKVNRMLGRPRAGEVFLNRLAKNPFRAAEVSRILEEYRADPSGASNAELSAIRALMPTNDAPSVYLPLEAQLHQVLRANFKNRMAYEYLMTFYLLNRNLEDAVAVMRRLGDMGYKTVPRHYEEAFLLYAREKKVNTQKIMGIPISEQTLKSYGELDKTLSSLAGNPEQLVAEMNRRFPGSYWRYYIMESIQAGLAVK